MSNKNEKIILQFIKYAPPVFIITLSLIISLSLYVNNQKTFNKERKLIEENYVTTNKEIIKDEVNTTYEYILSQKASTEAKLKENLKARVYEAYKIAMNIYEENKHLDKRTVQKKITDAIRTIRFNNGRGYFFIYSFDYECILLPIAPHIEGKNFYNFKDGKGTYLTRNIISQVKKEKEGFLKWWYHKPSDMKNQFEKLGFNKHFEPYDWFIGTGEYIEDFENDIKKEVLEHIHLQKYPNNGYIFVLDYDGNYLNHIRKEIIGLNALQAKDTRNNKIVFDTIEMVKKEGSGYITYIQNRKPGSDLPVRKTSYVKGIDDWQWFLGKGFYEDETNKIIQDKKEFLDKRLESNINNLFITSAILTTILLFISVYISRLLEQRFTQYKEDIDSHLNELTKQQNMLAQQSKMAAIGEMIANIAHQWRQPLSMISTAATGMKIKKEINQLEDKELMDNLTHINESTQYLSKTIDDFRNFFSTDKEEALFSIKESFENAINILGVQYKNKDIHIIKNIEDAQVLGIKNELTQVFINILNNSRDELIKLENQKRLIFVDIFNEDENIIIHIKDNGSGLNEDIIKDVFKPYFTTKNKKEGTGIGLYMSHEIITKNLEGEISIENSAYEFEGEKYHGALTIIKLKKQTS